MTAKPSEIIGFLKPLYPFRNMPEKQVLAVVDALQEVTFQKGDVIFTEEAESNRFYIIYEGQVELTRKKGEKEELHGTLESGNYFGYEAWDDEEPRKLTATAISSVRLFYLTTEVITELTWKSPLLGVFFELMFESYHLALRTKMDWRNPEEAVILFCRRHVLFLWIHLVGPIVGLVFSAVFLPILFYFGYPELTFILYIALVGGLLSALGALWAWIDWQNDDYIVTTQRILSRQKVLMLYDARQEAPLSAILSVTTGTTYWGRRFGYGEVNLRTYTGNIVFKGLPYYLELESLLKEKQTNVQIRYTQTEKRERIQTVRQRLGLDIPKTQENATPAPKAVETKDTLFTWLHNLFLLRIEKGGVITYRTHWLIMLRQTWLPGLLSILSLALAIAYIIYPFTPIPPLFVSGLFFLASIGLFLWWLYRFVDWRNDLYIITDDQVIDINRKPFGKEEKRSAPLNTIQSIEYERLGVIGLLFDFGTVSIRVGDDQLTFDYVKNPSSVQGEIFLRLARKRQNEKMTAMKNEGKLILDWIEAYHMAVEEKKKLDEKG